MTDAQPTLHLDDREQAESFDIGQTRTAVLLKTSDRVYAVWILHGPDGLPSRVAAMVGTERRKFLCGDGQLKYLFTEEPQ